MKYKNTLALLTLIALIIAPSMSAAQTVRGERDVREARHIREVVDIRGVSDDRYIARQNDEHVIVQYHGAPWFERVLLESGESVDTAVARLRARADVEYAEPDYIAHAFMVPNDSLYNYQWHFDNGGPGGIGMEEAWDVSDGSGVIVAVIDTGVAYENYNPTGSERYYRAPDFADSQFVSGWDFVNNDSHANDDNGHGTHVAGTVAQSTNNSEGVAGVAFGARIMPVKVLDGSGSGSHSAIANGIRWATDSGAHVINLSLGGSSGSQTLKNALKYAHDKGVVIVAAAGNDGRNLLSYPAAYDDYVIAVGATRYDEQLASYSNYGQGLDLVAPGGQMCASSSWRFCLANDQNGDGYGDGILQQTFSGATDNFGYYFYQGTSMAAPHVAGVAALVIANGNATGVHDVRTALELTAGDLGSLGWDSTYGHGLVNASAALAYGDSAPPPPPPEPEPAPETKPNEAPVANDQSVNDNEDTTQSIELIASDEDGDSLTYSIVNAPSHGSLSGAPPNVIYSPQSNYEGNDGFTFKAFDGKEDSNIATISITVHPVNDSPVVGTIADISFTGESVVSIDLNDFVTDVDNSDGDITWAISGNTNVNVSINGNNEVTFSASTGWTGSETLTAIATDLDGLSDSDTFTVTVLSKPAIPKAEVSVDVSTYGYWFWRASATVTVRVSGSALSGATLKGVWSGAYSAGASGRTNNGGSIQFRTSYIFGGGEATFTVTEISKNGVVYALEGDTEDSASVSTNASIR